MAGEELISEEELLLEELASGDVKPGELSDEEGKVVFELLMKNLPEDCTLPELTDADQAAVMLAFASGEMSKYESLTSEQKAFITALSHCAQTTDPKYAALENELADFADEGENGNDQQSQDDDGEHNEMPDKSKSGSNDHEHHIKDKPQDSKSDEAMPEEGGITSEELDA